MTRKYYILKNGNKISRVAFLSPEFPTELNDSGGIGNYTYKVCKYLQSWGFIVEVFVISKDPISVFSFNGIRVQRINIFNNQLFNLLRRVLNKILPSAVSVFTMLHAAWEFKKHLKKRENEVAFEFIQSANWYLSGLFIAKNKNRPHILRLSDSRILWDQSEGKTITISQKLIEKLTISYIKRVDYAYSPSRFLADYYNKNYHVNVGHIFPPLPELEIKNSIEGVNLSATKYIIHFGGTLGLRKGTDLVLDAISRCLFNNPDIKLFLAGRLDIASAGTIESDPILKGSCINLGPLEKEELYGYLQNSIASVLPSRIDNIPNTFLESIALGIPVICLDAGSANEIIVQNVNGIMVSDDDPKALAEVIELIWSGVIHFDKQIVKASLSDNFSSEQQIKKLLEVVRSLSEV